MHYFISRDGKEYGPYTLADLQRYVASGNIAVTDLTRSDGMTDWVPVSQVIGNIPVPVVAPSRPAEPMLRREGKKLVVVQGADLPPHCIKCGQLAEEKPWEKNFSWCRPWVYVLIVVGVLVWAIVYFITRKQMRLTVSLCEEHRKQRRTNLLVGSALLVGSPWLIILGNIVNNDGARALGALVLFLMLIAGLVVIRIAAPLRPTNIDDFRGTFLGAGEPFLAMVESQSWQTAGAGR